MPKSMEPIYQVSAVLVADSAPPIHMCYGLVEIGGGCLFHTLSIFMGMGGKSIVETGITYRLGGGAKIMDRKRKMSRNG